MLSPILLKLYTTSAQQHEQFAESSIMLEKIPIKVVTEANFLGVVFGRTLSSENHFDYLKTNCLKALDILKVVGHTDWWGGGADRKTTLSL